MGRPLVLRAPGLSYEAMRNGRLITPLPRPRDLKTYAGVRGMRCVRSRGGDEEVEAASRVRI